MSDIGDTLCRCGHSYSEHYIGECGYFSNDEDGVTYCGCENFEAAP